MGLSPCRTKTCSLWRPGWLWSLHSLLLNGYQRSGHNVNHSPLLSAEVKNKCNYTSASCLGRGQLYRSPKVRRYRTKDGRSYETSVDTSQTTRCHSRRLRSVTVTLTTDCYLVTLTSVSMDYRSFNIDMDRCGYVNSHTFRMHVCVRWLRS
jgi:hypothetical protein